MTNEELLACAVEFDAGPPPILNGQLFNPEWADAERYRVRIVQRFNAQTKLYKWAIHDGFHDLTKAGSWEYARSGSTTRADYLKRCRYETVHEAFDHYLRWKAAVLAWAQKKLAKAKPGERVILNPPRLKF